MAQTKRTRLTMEDVLRVNKPPLFQRENSDPQVDSILRSTGRYNSAEGCEGETKRRIKHHRSKKHSRSKSAVESSRFMSPLSFENIDLINTPLSSLRSCSEYNRVNSGQFIPKIVEHEVRKSFWSHLFGWGSHSNTPTPTPTPPPKAKRRVRFRSRDEDEQSFLVEHLRFNEANLMEDEYDLRPHRELDTATPTCFTALTTTRRTSSLSFSSSWDPFSSSSSSSSATRRSSADYSIFEDTSAAFDYLLGIKLSSKSRSLPMEIELKTLKEPEYFTVYSDATEAAENTENHAAVVVAVSGDPAGLSTLRRVTSLGVLERVVDDDDAQDLVHHHITTRTRSRTPSGAPEPLPLSPSFSLTDTTTWQPTLTRCYDTATSHVRRTFVSERDQEAFYELLRLQPFSSGGYLRGMLLAGFSSMIFQTYNLLTWPAELSSSLASLSLVQSWLLRLLYVHLLLQILLNLVQLPLRLRVHYLCWEASRAVEVDGAIALLRTLLHSDVWLWNRALGWVLDLCALTTLLVTEVYLYSSVSLSSQSDNLNSHSVHNSSADGVRSVVVSLCATNLLTLVCRVVVATAYTLSTQDPQVVSEARRRGLSKFDLDNLPTFFYTPPQQEGLGSGGSGSSAAGQPCPTECAICLCPFDMGEMLLSLPCSDKHHFHAGCIRTWLQRQNSCPLCQRLV